MSQRTTYGETILRETLESIARHIDEDLDIYLIGGGAMMFYNLKPATKDIDIVFQNKDDMGRFIKAAHKAGIIRRDDPGEEYKNIGASIIMVADSGIQLDLFNRVVCNALELKDTVSARATHHEKNGKLHIKLMSREDIAFFKSITEREADLEDIRTLTEAGLDWSIVEDECLNQEDSGVWADMVLKKLSELQEKYGIRVRLNKLVQHADSYILEKSFKTFIGEGEKTFSQIYEKVEETGYSKTWTRNKLKELDENGFLTSRRSGRAKLYKISDQLP